MAVADSSARSLVAAFRAGHPSFDAVMAASALSCAILSLDSARSNMLFMAITFARLQPRQMGLIIRCMHHQAGLVLRPFVARQRMICSLFCLARQWQNGDVLRRMLKEARFILEDESEFVVLREGTPEWTPIDSADRAFNQTVMENSYFKINCQSVHMTADERRQYQAHDKGQRLHGDKLLNFFTSKWSNSKIVHHCRHGCCESREQSIEKDWLGC
eukprot:6145887-Pyramimonas_sp.AAC.1